MKTSMRNAALTLALALMAFPAGASTLADQEKLEKSVRHELLMLPYFGVFDNLEYQVEESKVTLYGQTIRPTTKSSAERVVARLEGVSEVDNQIEVLPLSAHDDRIRLAVARAVYGNAVLDRYALGAHPRIKVLVKNGDVTLEGVVARELDKNVATAKANGVAGVFSVTNNLKVEKKKS